MNPDHVIVRIQRVEVAEVDEMWSFVNRKDAAFLKLKTLLKPFGIARFYTDDWGAYQRHLPTHRHTIGKQQTQTIERKHLTLRTRIKRPARKTICFSKLTKMQILSLDSLSTAMNLAFLSDIQI